MTDQKPQSLEARAEAYATDNWSGVGYHFLHSGYLAGARAILADLGPVREALRCFPKGAPGWGYAEDGLAIIERLIGEEK